MLLHLSQFSNWLIFFSLNQKVNCRKSRDHRCTWRSRTNLLKAFYVLLWSTTSKSKRNRINWLDRTIGSKRNIFYAFFFSLVDADSRRHVFTVAFLTFSLVLRFAFLRKNMWNKCVGNSELFSAIFSLLCLVANRCRRSSVLGFVIRSNIFSSLLFACLVLKWWSRKRNTKGQTLDSVQINFLLRLSLFVLFRVLRFVWCSAMKRLVEVNRTPTTKATRDKNPDSVLLCVQAFFLSVSALGFGFFTCLEATHSGTEIKKKKQAKSILVLICRTCDVPCFGWCFTSFKTQTNWQWCCQRFFVVAHLRCVLAGDCSLCACLCVCARVIFCDLFTSNFSPVPSFSILFSFASFCAFAFRFRLFRH